ncbi:MAG: circularly permuted type 2 ATP-grasp protein [Chloroherpetonaceae bacterium]|nr:circularly permuted type 2 ATP-grasp protein [Chloroherpetonaceae bacterium]
MNFNKYDKGPFYDEMFLAGGETRPCYDYIKSQLELLGTDELMRRKYAAERYLLNLGITFNVYGSSGGTEQIFPFDLIPRLIEHHEWVTLDKGLKQRITALNLFINDVYHERHIVRDGIIPNDILESSKGYLPQCNGLKPPKGIWCHITGTDLVRDGDGKFYVLEDNLRCPSGVSYVIANREVMKRTLPEAFEKLGVFPVVDYPMHLLEMLQSVTNKTTPVVAVLTPGIYNSAYFEHSFLAQQMGVELVVGTDLFVRDYQVYMRTTKGPEKVDVIYRRIDDTFIDPLAFRPDSLLGIPGIFEAYKKGNVTFVNAPGTGVADDKVIYAYVPRIIKYYLGEEAIIPNVPTYMCWQDDERNYVLQNLNKLVVKTANESGGYGMLIGPHASENDREEFKHRIASNPRNYIAQPTISLSRVPTIVENEFEGRHVDFRPYILYGEKIYVLPGGLTRVALKKGSLVVNSSQGGGSKDTWVLSK